jgi:hypothetical protein
VSFLSLIPLLDRPYRRRRTGAVVAAAEGEEALAAEASRWLEGVVFEANLIADRDRMEALGIFKKVRFFY